MDYKSNSLPDLGHSDKKSTTTGDKKGPVRRVLLIGIDAYQTNPQSPNASFKNLKGCVQDVNAIDHFLSCHIEGCITTKLITTTPQDADLEPTFANITKALKKLRKDCQAGDLVYIHFSCHGLSRQNNNKDLPSDGGSKLEGMALVPTDALITKKYITGRYLGTVVQQITQIKDTHVFIVLDSCFSGGGFRDTDTPSEFTARYDDQFFATDAAMKSTNDEIREMENCDTQWRNTSTQSDWFANPIGCTIITACGRDQTAGENSYEIEGGETKKHGSLTYWMLDTLKDRARHGLSRPTCAQITKHVFQKTSTGSCSKSIGGREIIQSPKIIGDSHVEFFGKRRVTDIAFCHVISVSRGVSVLNAGTIQGVFPGAVFEIVREVISPEGRPSSNRISQIRIADATAFTSKGDEDSVEEDESSWPRVGDVAFLRDWALPNQVSVRLVSENQGFRELFQYELAKGPLPGFHYNNTGSNTQEDEIEVKVGNDSILEFRDRNRTLIPRLPEVTQQTHDAAKMATHIVRHITRYNAIERQLLLLRSSNCNKIRVQVDLRRVKAEFRGEDIDIALWPERFEHISKTCPSKEVQYCELEDKDSLWCTLSRPEHQSSYNLWLAVFELNACWQIEKKFPQGQDAQVVGPDPLHLKITGTIPTRYNDQDPGGCVDKYFILIVESKSEPSWDMLTLPSMPTENSLLPLDQDDNLGPDSAKDDEELRSDVQERKRTGWETPTRSWIHPFEIIISPASGASNTESV